MFSSISFCRPFGSPSSRIFISTVHTNKKKKKSINLTLPSASASQRIFLRSQITENVPLRVQQGQNGLDLPTNIWQWVGSSVDVVHYKQRRPGVALWAGPEIPESLVFGNGLQYRRAGAYPWRARKSCTSSPYLATNLTTTLTGSPVMPGSSQISARYVTHAASFPKDARYRIRLRLPSLATNEVGYGK